MPFKSRAQRRKFAQLLVEGKIDEDTFEEWNRETGGDKLPERVGAKPARKAKKTARKKSATKKKAATKTKRAGAKKRTSAARKTTRKSKSKRKSK